MTSLPLGEAILDGGERHRTCNCPCQSRRLGLLKALYGAVLIPPAVHGELLAKLGAEIGQIDDALNDFLQVAPPPSLTLEIETLTQGLGPGERQAIALAVLAKSALLLIDDRAGRRVAAQLGIPVTGVVGVLIRAKQDGLISSRLSPFGGYST